MRIDSQLRALRGDPAPQRKAQAELDEVRSAWLGRGAAASILAELGKFGEGAPLAECRELEAAVTRMDGAEALVAPLVEAMVRALRANPLGQVPFRHQRSGGSSVIQIAEAGRAVLSLVTYEKGAGRDTQSVCFGDSERHEIFLAGAADARIFAIAEESVDRAVLASEERRLEAGDTLRFAGGAGTKLIDRVHGRLVMLRLGRTAPFPAPSREFRLSDGALLHRASGCGRESRQEMMMAVLGRMGRIDAAPVIQRLTRDGSDHFRWQAVRQCLALDIRRGFAVLGQLSEKEREPLCKPARALQRELLDAHPQLAGLETKLCPA